MTDAFHTITLGCKLNQFDTAAIEGELTRRGFAPSEGPESAAVVIVNTCTVTHKADTEARRIARHVRRGNPRCLLLVTGCYAELDAETLRAMPEIDLVFGNRDKPRLAQILDSLGLHGHGRRLESTDRGCDGAEQLPDELHFGERSRAFLKIQQGCRLACSYCIIPTVRGPSRSVSAARVVEAACRLWNAGYHEIVLTGVNTGDWGRDLGQGQKLADLLRSLLAVADGNRIRLNSLEPLTVSDEIVALIASEPRLASHLQVPLQSGSDRVLRAMRRNYRARDYAERIARLRAAAPQIGLGADVIVGFPGEDDAAFEETYRLVQSTGLNYLHVFSWSPRPGTPASELPGRSHPTKVRARSARLRELAALSSLQFRQRFVGGELDAVVLDARDGHSRALTDNFIEVSLDRVLEPRGPVRVRIERVTADSTSAVPVGVPAYAASAATRPPGP